MSKKVQFAVRIIESPVFFTTYNLQDQHAEAEHIGLLWK